MDLPLLEKLKRRWPTDRWQGLTVVIGCSGGADSTALLLAANQLKPVDSTLIVAHFNHRLRGSESDQDQQFVAEIAAKLNCLFVCNSVNLSSAPNSNVSEASLRDQRYHYLCEVAKSNGARYVAVAHTADDSVETTLHNLVRGTGLNGLTGIASHRDLNKDLVLIRPLIDAWRSEVVDFLHHNQQVFRNDSSNASLVYTRNRIRHRWIPMLEEEFGSDARLAIHRTSTLLTDLQSWLNQQAQEWLDQRIIHVEPNRVELRVIESGSHSWPVVQQSLSMLWQQQSWPLRAMTYEHWNRIRTLFELPLPHSSVVELPSKICVSQINSRWVIAMKTCS